MLAEPLPDDPGQLTMQAMLTDEAKYKTPSTKQQNVLYCSTLWRKMGNFGKLLETIDIQYITT